MKLRLAGIHNKSQHPLWISHHCKKANPLVVIARGVDHYLGGIDKPPVKYGSQVMPIKDLYQPLRNKNNEPSPAFKPDDKLTILPKGYIRFHDLILSGNTDGIIFTLGTDFADFLALRTFSDGNNQFIEYRTRSEELFERTILGKQEAHDTVDFYITFSPQVGFLVEPMNENFKRFKLEAFNVAHSLYAFLKQQINTVYLPIGGTSNKSFSMYLQAPSSKKPEKPVEIDCFVALENTTLKEQFEKKGGSCVGSALFAPTACLDKTDAAGKKRALSQVNVNVSGVFTITEKHQGQFAIIKINSLLRLVNDQENTVIQWKIIQSDKSKHRIDASNGQLTVDLSQVNTSITLVATIQVRFEIPLPEDFPKMFRRDDFDLPWLMDKSGKESVAILYKIYENCNAHQKSILKNLWLFLTFKEDARTHFNPITKAICIQKFDLRAHQTGEIASLWMRMIGNAFIDFKLTQQGYSYATILQMIYLYHTYAFINRPFDMLQLPGVYVNVVVSPLYFMSIIADSMDQTFAAINDDVRKFSEVTEWEMKNLHFKTVPLIGWFCSTFLKMPPNYLYSLMLEYNPGMNLHLMMFNKKLKDKKWQEAGMSSETAMKSPIQDLLTAMVSQTLDGGILQKLKPEIREPNQVRKDFVKKNYLDTSTKNDKTTKQKNLDGTPLNPDKWLPLTIDQLDYYKDITFTHSLGYGSLLHIGDGSEVTTFQHLEAAQTLFEQWCNDFADESNTLLQTKRKILQTVYEANAAQASTSLGVAQLCEKYGNGLHPYGTSDVKNESGNLLLDKELMPTKRGLWMVSRTDKTDNSLKEVQGFVDLKADLTVSMFVKKLSDFSLTWLPATTLRTWTTTTKTDYPDLNTSLRKLIDCWGFNADPVSKKPLHTAGHFFSTFLDMCGLRIPDVVFKHDDILQNMYNYMNATGNGSVFFDMKTINPEPGDVIIPYHENTVGIVLRNRGNGLLDIVMSGGHPREKEHLYGIGETDDQVKLLHSYHVQSIKYYWKPSRQFRQFTTLNTKQK